MATFPYSSDWGCKPTMTPRVNKCQFGDGYDQRSGDGINTRLPVWPLTFSIRTQTEAQAIAAWLATNNADVTAFDWVAPGSGTATSEWFGTGTGTQATFQLTHGGSPVTSIVGTPTIYRTDWQGTQQLYATARTNYFLQSNTFSSSSWAKTGGSISGPNVTGPDGTTSAYTFTEDSSTGGHQVQQSVTVPGGTYTVVAVVSPIGRTSVVVRTTGTFANSFCLFSLAGAGSYTGIIGGVAPLSASIRLLPNGHYEIKVTNPATAGTTYAVIYSSDGGSTINIAGIGAAAWSVYHSGIYDTTGVYIPTTTAAITVTDYTLSGTGLVTLAVAPVSGAGLTWTGNYTRKYIADEWTPATADDWGSWSVTAKFRQVPA